MSCPVYANSITLTVNDNRTEFVMTLKHLYPTYDEKSQVAGQNEETVASVVISADMARSIHNVFSQMLNIDEKVEPADG